LDLDHVSGMQMDCSQQWDEAGMSRLRLLFTCSTKLCSDVYSVKQQYYKKIQRAKREILTNDNGKQDTHVLNAYLSGQMTI
jgi:hypothetical protein